MKKRLLSMLLAAVMLLSAVPLGMVDTAWAAVASGECGDNVTWELTDDGTLTISGTGAMDNTYTPWENYKKSIKSVVIQQGVTSIGNSVFSVCTGLTSVTIPDSVTSIEGAAFYYCTSLTSVTIPEGVTSIGNVAFENCSSLTSVTIPSSVTSIGNDAFRYCSGLTDVYYGGWGIDWVKLGVSVPENATMHFKDGLCGKGECGDNMTWELTDDGTLTISGDGAMKNYIDSSELPWYSNRNSIKSVVIQQGVLSIGSLGGYAFYDCKNLMTVTIPDSVIEISSSAFSGCTSLTDIYYGGTVEGWKRLDASVPASATVHFKENIYDKGECGDSVTWKLTFDGTLTISGTGAMMDCTASPWDGYRKSVKSVVIQQGVTSIGGFAFSGCTSLTSVTIPGSVTSIGNYAFSGCWGLTSVTIPGSVTSIGDSAFEDCGKLTSVTIPEGVTSIGNAAFQYCSGLTSVTIPGSVTSIGEYAFNGCSSLTDVYYGGWGIDWVKLGVSVPENATMHFKDGLYDKGECGINVTWELTDDGTLTISGTGRIGNYSYDGAPWYGCRWHIKRVVIQQGVRAIGDAAFRSCTGLTSVTIPGSVASIGSEAFRGCTSLTSVTIPEGVTYIYGETFSNCVRLAKVTIPKSVTSIDSKAFYYCDSLTDVYYAGTAADWAKVSISSGNEDLTNATLHCAAAVLAAPTMSAATNTSGKPVLSWTKVNGAAQYEVWRSTTGKSGSYSIVRRTATLTYTDETAAAGSTYYYVVRAMNGSTYSKYSAAQKITCKVTSLAAPTVTASTNTSGKPVLSWTKVSGAAQYEVWRSTTGKSGSYSIVRRTATLTYTDDKAALGSTYYYVVRAKSGATYSKYSAAQKITCKAPVLTAPTVTASTNSSGKPVLSWTKVPGAAQYEVWRSATGNAGSYSIVRRTATLTYTDDKAALGSTYYYVVRAKSGATYSKYSAAQKITCKAPVLTAPTVTASTNSSGKPVLSWTKVPGAAQYEVWRSATGNAGSYAIVRRTATLTYTDETATAGTTYYYVVRAMNGTVYSGYSTAQKLACTGIGTPTLIMGCDLSDGKTVVGWTKVTGAAYYEVWRAKALSNGSAPADAAYTLLLKTGDTASKDTSAVAGTLYYYKVRGVRGSVYGAFSQTESYRCDVPPTMDVPNLRPISLNASGKPVLTWDAVDGAAGYMVFRMADGDWGYTNICNLPAGDGAVMTWTDTSAVSGTTYTYGVSCYDDDGGRSSFDNQRTITVD